LVAYANGKGSAASQIGIHGSAIGHGEIAVALSPTVASPATVQRGLIKIAANVSHIRDQHGADAGVALPQYQARHQ